MTRRFCTAPLAVATAFASIATAALHAHEGHVATTAASSPVHWLVEPMHGSPLLLLALAGLIWYAVVSRRRTPQAATVRCNREDETR